MKPHLSWHLILSLVFVAGAAPPLPGQETDSAASAAMRGALLPLDELTDSRIAELKRRGINTVVLPLSTNSHEPDPRLQSAAAQVRDQGWRLFYWIEVARCPELADAHPEWMASLQGHDEWQRLFTDPPQPDESQVVKVYPWVPIFYREAFEAHLQRITDALRRAPTPDGVFLNDLQGAPSACGCGNTLCRWTADYGPIRTATPAGEEAAARFVAAVEKLVPQATVVPVWVTECEEHDGAAEGACAGVGCFRGICWKAYTRQLMPVAQRGNPIGVLTPYVELGRDLPVYGTPAGWIRQAVESFQTMPPLHDGRAVPRDRLIAILQGWDVEPSQLKAQIEQATEVALGGFVIADYKIDQSWRPQLYRWK